MDDFAATLADRMNAITPRVAVAVPAVVPTKADAPAFLRLWEAAERARVTTKTLRTWEGLGLKVSRPSPGVVLVRTSDLDDFISDGAVRVRAADLERFIDRLAVVR